MKVLLVGADGQIGFDLWRCLQFNQEVIPTTTDGRDINGMTTIKLDLADPDDLEKKLKNIAPDVICNAAAYTQVDNAETQQDLARIINTEAVSRMAYFARSNRLHMIHYSTDYVFSGDRDIPWIETDATEPKSVYGRSKMDGEQAIIDSKCDHMIFRTSWVFSDRRHNFLRSMLKLAENRREIDVVNDQIGAPTWSFTLAMATMIAMNIPQPGLYHLTSSGSTTWCGFARKIFSQAQKINLIEDKPVVNAISTEDYPTPAVRPKNSVLNCRKFEGTFNVKLPHWQTALQLCMQRMKK